MITLEKITPQHLAAYKTVRLRALQESPSAFGSTYARESQFTDSEWTKRAENFSSARGVGFLAVDDPTMETNANSPNAISEPRKCCGIAGGFLDEHDSTKALLVAMWVAPDRRRAGIGTLLIRAVESWAAQQGATALRLKVTSINQAAIELYLRTGFTMTGNTEPYPNDPALFEYEMSKPLPTSPNPPRALA